MTRPGETLFVNGAVWDGVSASSIAEAIAFRNGHVVARGNEREVAQYLSGRQEIVDLQGRLLVPGFIDSHVHPADAGYELANCALLDSTSRVDCLQRIRDFHLAHPADEWIVGGGWSFDFFERGIPSAHLLDEIVGTRPVALYNRDHHTLWANTEAMRRAGVDGSTSDPHDGRIERDRGGHPVGCFQEGAMRLIEAVMPQKSVDDLEVALLEAQAYLHRQGVTGWQDAMVTPDIAKAYAQLDDNGQLKADVVGALKWDRRGDATQLEELRYIRESNMRSRFRPNTVKIMLDGVCENHTAAMIDPYLLPGRAGDLGIFAENAEHRHGGHGISFFAQPELEFYLNEISSAGFQAHFHAVGDRAVRQALDALETVPSRHRSERWRPHIAHVQVVHPDDIRRFARVGATANVQTLWARLEPQMTELTIPYLGEQRAAWQYPFGDFSRSNVRMAAGSDWPVSSPNPLYQVHVAVNRTPAPPGNSWTEETGALTPNQRLTLLEAMRGFTGGSAYVNGAESRAGNLSVGAQADAVVLSEDVFAVRPEDLWAISVHETWVAGERVFHAEG